MQTHLYSDFDAFACDVRDVECTMMLQNVKRRFWSVAQLDFPGAHIQMGQLGSGNLLEGQSASHGYLFYLPLSNGCEYLGNGTSFSPGAVWLLEPGAEFCLSTREQHDWCTVFVPSDRLVLADGVNGPSAGTERSTCRVLSPDRRIVHGFEALVRDTMLAATKCETFETSFAAKRAAVAATSLARFILGEHRANEPRQRGRPSASRSDILRSCMEHLEERRGERVLVSDLVAGAGVSERTLRTVFNEYFGVSPARYLQLRRLHAVHRELRAADLEETLVSDVLARNGEWEFGRFAARYRRLFGELPSETLTETHVFRRDPSKANDAVSVLHP